MTHKPARIYFPRKRSLKDFIQIETKMIATEYELKPLYAQLLSDESPDPDAADLDLDSEEDEDKDGDEVEELVDDVEK